MLRFSSDRTPSSTELARSEQQDKFVFKGGLLLAQYLILGRETTDADFFVQKMKAKIQIDIGVGDLVDAIIDNFEPFQYKGNPVFEGKISLLLYPVETIFAEKLDSSKTR